MAVDLDVGVGVAAVAWCVEQLGLRDDPYQPIGLARLPFLADRLLSRFLACLLGLAPSIALRAMLLADVDADAILGGEQDGRDLVVGPARPYQLAGDRE